MDHRWNYRLQSFELELNEQKQGGECHGPLDQRARLGQATAGPGYLDRGAGLPGPRGRATWTAGPGYLDRGAGLPGPRERAPGPQGWATWTVQIPIGKFYIVA